MENEEDKKSVSMLYLEDPPRIENEYSDSSDSEAELSHTISPTPDDTNSKFVLYLIIKSSIVHEYMLI